MTKRLLFLFTFVLAFSQLAFAQSRTVNGRVVNSSGLPLSLVSIVEKGTQNGTTTNEAGEFTLSLITRSPVLQISYAGMSTQEIVVGNNTQFQVRLEAGNTNLSEVVVTAMGIKREKRSLGYAAQTVSASDLQVNKQSNVINSLQGKVAGVTISSTGGAPGQGARIIVRGINSLDPSRPSQPLFIVDGVEVDNSTFTVGGGDTRGMTNRAADINPDDIESVTVLKGGAATALYGIRAANGAVIITTKSARSGKLSVSYTGTYGFENVAMSPDVQMKFSQGYLGVYDSTSFWPSFGPAVEDAKKRDATHPDQIFDNFKRAYQTGTINRHTINLTGGSDLIQLGGSFSFNDQKGVIPFSDHTSYNARAFGNLNISPKFKSGFSVNFINSGGSRVNADRYGEQLIYWSPRWDVMDYIKPDGTQKNYGVDNDNPVYTLATNRFFDNVNRTIASVNFQYIPKPWLSLTYRIGNDFYADFRNRYAPGPKGVVGELVNSDNDFGFVGETDLKNRVITSTFIANINKEFGDAFSLNLNLGHDLTDKKYTRTSTFGDTLDVFDFYVMQNAKKITADSYREDYRNYGFFGDLTLGYNNYLFLNLTGRNDFTSTLNPENRSYFYPSASLSFVFSDMFQNAMPSWFNYGKAKASFAKVAKDGTPYSILSGFGAAEKIGNIIPYTQDNRLGNLGLRPEFTDTYEGGIEFRFLQNRLGLELTRYVANSKDLLVPVRISNATGFDEVYLNAGEISNKGWEATINAIPVRSKDFGWDFNINYSRNKSRVDKLYGDLTEIIQATQFGYISSSATMKLVPGYPLGAIFGRTYRRYYGSDEDDGITLATDRPLLISKTGSATVSGFPMIDTRQRYLGSSEPKYILSTLQNFRFRNISLTALLDVREGLMKYNQFANFMAAFGTAKFTENRTETRIFDGVYSDGTANTKPVYLGQATGPDGVNYGNGYYRNIYRGVTENFVEDASWVRLRSVSLGFNIPQAILENSKFIKGATATVTGNNLWIKTKFTGFDPESSSFSSGSNAAEGFSGFTYPGVRSILFSVNLQF